MDNKQLATLGMILSFFLPPVGIIISAVALSKFKQSGETDGKGFAIAGLIIGIVIVVLGIAITSCITCIGIAAIGGSGY